MAVKMDWLRLERKLRDALANLHNDCDGDWDKLTRDQMSATLFEISECIGEETGRGYPLGWADGANRG